MGDVILILTKTVQHHSGNTEQDTCTLHIPAKGLSHVKNIPNVSSDGRNRNVRIGTLGKPPGVENAEGERQK